MDEPTLKNSVWKPSYASLFSPLFLCDFVNKNHKTPTSFFFGLDDDQLKLSLAEMLAQLA